MATRISWDFKDPDEELDYDINWSDRLPSGDTIVSSDWTIVAGNVTNFNEAFTTSVTKIWLSGGTLGETCELLNRVETAGGRTMDQTVYLKIKKR